MLRNALTKLVGKFMLKFKIQYRFPKDYRWGITWWNRLIYRLICTFEANIIADGIEWRD